jgi:hypothetical protein
MQAICDIELGIARVIFSYNFKRQSPLKQEASMNDVLNRILGH